MFKSTVNGDKYYIKQMREGSKILLKYDTLETSSSPWATPGRPQGKSRQIIPWHSWICQEQGVGTWVGSTTSSGQGRQFETSES